jgi:hypothetical protein
MTSGALSSPQKPNNFGGVDVLSEFHRVANDALRCPISDARMDLQANSGRPAGAAIKTTACRSTPVGPRTRPAASI